MTAYVHRPFYENKLQQHKSSTDIKVITGVRRCGKSSLMGNLAEQAQADVGKANVFYRRMDQFGIPLSPTAEWLERELADALSKRNADRMFYVFLDEIQDVSCWEKVVRRLHTQEDIDAYITGSNAHVLSSDLATLLGGRYAQILVQPLSFAEFLSFANARNVTFANIDAAFAEYVRYGGMPAQFDLPERTEEQLAGLLETIYETIVLNDVAMHASIADFDLLSKLVRSTFSTSGNLYSTRAVVNTLASAGRKTSSETVDNYLKALFDAFILDECEQTGLAGKQVLRPQRKLYPVDNGLRNVMTRFSPGDFGAQIECVVFNELKRRKLHPEVGVLRAGEIDFVAYGKNGEKEYIQVTASMTDDVTYERELAPFEGLPDSFPKTVLTLDHYRTGITETGVRIVNLIDWLLETDV